MKWLVFIAGAILSTVAVFLVLDKQKRRDTLIESDEMDGGVTHYDSGEDAPKTINSTEIVKFNCTFSLLACSDCDDLGKLRYAYNAKTDNKTVNVTVESFDRISGEKGSFIADYDFMRRLSELVIKHRLVEHNGFFHKVSGLPDMYGASIDIVYESGEYIHAYDNQSNFLTYEAMSDIKALFDSCKAK
ncbi:MAG: hypothetical protein IJD67_04765 [Clostridia bacterium]|nr:hypothetical protein [Clostridia bacterium]